MNQFIVTGVVRWLVNTVIGVLLTKGLIATGDQSAWATTFTQLFFGLASVGMLLWTILSNRFPSLVTKLADLKDVEKVIVTPQSATPALDAHPSVEVAPVTRKY